jgi:hypothetical protein
VNFRGRGNSAAFYVGAGSTLRDLHRRRQFDRATPRAAVLAVGGGALERVVRHASGVTSSRACLVGRRNRRSTTSRLLVHPGKPPARNSSALSGDPVSGGVENGYRIANVTALRRVAQGSAVSLQTQASTPGVHPQLRPSSFARGRRRGRGGRIVRYGSLRHWLRLQFKQGQNWDHSKLRHRFPSRYSGGDITDTGTAWENIPDPPLRRERQRSVTSFSSTAPTGRSTQRLGPGFRSRFGVATSTARPHHGERPRPSGR